MSSRWTMTCMVQVQKTITLKKLSSRKADREGHCVDALADPFSSITLLVRFMRRGQSQAHSVDEILRKALRKISSQSNKGLVVTEDRGYAKLALLRSLMGHGVRYFCVIPENIAQCHSFVGKSFLKVEGVDSDEKDSEMERNSDDCLSSSSESAE